MKSTANQITFASGRSDCRVRFTVPAKEVGWQEYIVGVEPVEGETNLANNYYPVSFEVVRDHLRILLADGVPRWEYRYLDQLFRRDQHIEFDELLFSPTVHGTGRSGRPARVSDRMWKDSPGTTSSFWATSARSSCRPPAKRRSTSLSASAAATW